MGTHVCLYCMCGVRALCVYSCVCAHMCMVVWGLCVCACTCVCVCGVHVCACAVWGLCVCVLVCACVCMHPEAAQHGARR